MDRLKSAAILGACLGILAAGAGCGETETWVFSFEERHYTRCVDDFDVDGVSYDQEGQANTFVDIHRGPWGVITIAWDPTLIGILDRGDFEASSESSRTTASEGGTRQTDEAVYISGTFDGKTVEGTLEDERITTTTFDSDGDGVPDQAQVYCYQENPFTGWRL